MNWQTIVLSLLSGILASTLTLLGEHYIFKLSTREKYREKIIDKRIEAYAELCKLATLSEYEAPEVYRDKLRNWLAESSLYSSVNILRYVLNSVVDTWSEAGPVERSIKSRIRLVDILEYIRKELGLELAEPQELEKVFGRKREE